MQGRSRIIAKVLLLVPFSIIASVYFLGPGGIVSFNPATRASVHSLLAFWIAVPTATGIIAYIKRPLRAHLILTSSLFFPMIIHTGSAAKNLFILNQSTVEYTSANAVLDLFQFALMGLLFLFFSLCYSRPQLIRQQKLSWLTIISIFLIPPACYGLFWYFLNFGLPSSMLVGLAWVIEASIVIVFFTTLYFIPRIKLRDLPLDKGFFAASVLMIIASSIALLLSLISTSMDWVLAESIQIASYLILGLSFSVPFLKNVGFSRRAAYTSIIGLMLMAYIPLLATIIIESQNLQGLDPFSVLGFSVIHIGAGSLAGMMGLLLFLHSRRKPRFNYYPLILLFGLWATISLMQILIVANPAYNEPLISFISGSLLTLILLFLSIQWTLRAPKAESPPLTFLKLSIGYAITVALVIGGEMINRYVIDTYHQLQNGPIGPAILLVTNLIIVLALSFLIFVLANQSKGRISIDLFVVFFLTMWILPNILKSYYGYWSAGWWVSETLLFAVSLAGPPLLAWLYIQETHESEQSRAKADLLADLLMHDITNYLQMILTSLELLGSKDMENRQRERVAQDGFRVISVAEQLINNVRLLSETERSKHVELRPMNLVSVLVAALDSFSKQGLSDRVIVEFRPEIDRAPVMANELLHHIFLNILYSALEATQEERSISVEIKSVNESGVNWWETTFEVPGQWVRQAENFRIYNPANNTYQGNSLGLLAAKIMTDSLRGQFIMCEGKESEDNIRTVFVIRLLEFDEND
jgi:signal transduction histidine kinase